MSSTAPAYAALRQASMNFDELIPDQLKHHLSPSGTYDADLPGSAAPNVLFWSAFLINIEISKGLISASAAESAINDTDSFAKHLGVGISLNGGRGRGGRGGRLSISVPCIFWSEAQLSPETVRSDVNLRLQAARMSAWCRKYLPDLPSDISDVDFILENTAKLAEESSDTDKGEDESCTASNNQSDANDGPAVRSPTPRAASPAASHFSTNLLGGLARTDCAMPRYRSPESGIATAQDSQSMGSSSHPDRHAEEREREHPCDNCLKSGWPCYDGDSGKGRVATCVHCKKKRQKCTTTQPA